MKKALYLIVVLLLAIFTVSAEGVDDQGNVNDPTVNDRANDCYEGGVLEGRCETDLDWIAGWYLIRYRFDLFDSVPSWVAWVLPQTINVEVVVEDSGPCGSGLTAEVLNGQTVCYSETLFDPGKPFSAVRTGDVIAVSLNNSLLYTIIIYPNDNASTDTCSGGWEFSDADTTLVFWLSKYGYKSTDDVCPS